MCLEYEVETKRAKPAINSEAILLGHGSVYKEAKPVKKEYEKPELILYGDLNELSGAADGSQFLN